MILENSLHRQREKITQSDDVIVDRMGYFTVLLISDNNSLLIIFIHQNGRNT